jgi:NAD-dependent SIR2 family protein deacetylase
MFSKTRTLKSTKGSFDDMEQSFKTARAVESVRQKIKDADAVLIGAGAGLSTSAGFTYAGERFDNNFADFIEKYGFQDMYSAGFYPYRTLEEHWAYWSRYIDINRYQDAPKPVYNELLEIVRELDYFVLTTNVDHCFQKAGFDKQRLFYTQGDYGLWQCSKPCHDQTYDNEEVVKKMVAQQEKMRIPSELIPRCPVCGAPMSMNLRSDDTFVQDDGWYAAADRYQDFIERHQGMKMLYLELGVGSNTPGIIKYPFWQMTADNPKASYVCINYGQAYAPKEIAGQSVCLNGDIGSFTSILGTVYSQTSHFLLY